MIQVAYYRHRAAEYDMASYGDLPGAERRITALTARLQPAGEVLEVACGTGLWTRQLLSYARAVTAIDAAPEMIAVARQRVPAGVGRNGARCNPPQGVACSSTRSRPGRSESPACHAGIGANPNIASWPPCRRASPVAPASTSCASGDHDSSPAKSTKMSGRGQVTSQDRPARNCAIVLQSMIPVTTNSVVDDPTRLLSKFRRMA
jgi:hypothetical protein